MCFHGETVCFHGEGVAPMGHRNYASELLYVLLLLSSAENITSLL